MIYRIACVVFVLTIGCDSSHSPNESVQQHIVAENPMDQFSELRRVGNQNWRFGHSVFDWSNYVVRYDKPITSENIELFIEEFAKCESSITRTIASHLPACFQNLAEEQKEFAEQPFIAGEWQCVAVISNAGSTPDTLFLSIDFKLSDDPK